METYNTQKLRRAWNIKIWGMISASHGEREKATVPVMILIEMLLALDEWGNAKITEVIIETYDRGGILKYLSRSIVALPNKRGANECEIGLSA